MDECIRTVRQAVNFDGGMPVDVSCHPLSRACMEAVRPLLKLVTLRVTLWFNEEDAIDDWFVHVLGATSHACVLEFQFQNQDQHEPMLFSLDDVPISFPSIDTLLVKTQGNPNFHPLYFSILRHLPRLTNIVGNHLEHPHFIAALHELLRQAPQASTLALLTSEDALYND